MKTEAEALDAPCVEAKPDQGLVDPLVGRVLAGRYRVLAPLARGGMGRIYVAEQMALQRRVALKLLGAVDAAQAAQSLGGDYPERFLREASVLGRLQHANIVTLFDYGRIDEEDVHAYFLTMELLVGESLQKRLRARGRLEVREALRIVGHVCAGLRAAHACGVVHRDLKPSNIMLVRQDDGSEEAKLIDFGIVKVSADREDQALTQAGYFLGTPAYVSPEQILGGAVDTRSDIYSLGVILYYCLTGTLPLGKGGSATLAAHLNQVAAPMSTRVIGLVLPEWLEALVTQCLAKEPSARPQSVDQVLSTIRRESEPRTGADTPHTTDLHAIAGPPRPSPRAVLTVGMSEAEAPVARSRRPWGVVVAGLVGALALALVLIGGVRARPPESASAVRATVAVTADSARTARYAAPEPTPDKARPVEPHALVRAPDASAPRAATSTPRPRIAPAPARSSEPAPRSVPPNRSLDIELGR